MRKLNDNELASYKKRKASRNLPTKAKILLYYPQSAAVCTRPLGWCLNPEAT